MPATSAFLPSHHAFAYENAWPSQAAVVIPTPLGDLKCGNANGGLCGGMVFAILDYWHLGLMPPTGRPAQSDPVYGFIVRRLIDSWHLPAGVAQYFQWMNLPDGDIGFTAFGRRVVVERGLAWRTVRVQWPQIVRDLDKGLPVALGVVTTASRDPRDLGLNHQVLAYGYEKTDSQISVRVYDPNRGQRDDITIRFTTSSPTKPTEFAHNLDLAHPVRGFFRTAYSPASPPAA